MIDANQFFMIGETSASDRARDRQRQLVYYQLSVSGNYVIHATG